MKIPVALLAFALLLPVQPATAASNPDERIEALVVYGNDACPIADDGSIIVCARKPESERYRIPKELREKAKEQKQLAIGEQGWAANVQSLEVAGQVLLPNSCSTIGSNGFTGCSLTMLRQWYAERQLAGRAPPNQ